MNNQSNQIIITAIQGVSATGTNAEQMIDDIWSNGAMKNQSQCQMTNFKAAPLLSDRRMLKAVSKRDSYGLAAIENLKKERGFSDYDTYRIGMYVGAPPSSTDDHGNYLDAVVKSRQSDGTYKEADFGQHCMQSRPTTLLLGLPNNVLCYGSIIMDARGPNNNYTSAEISSHLAIQAAVRNLKMNRVDGAIAGGYTEHTDTVRFKMHQAHGWLAPEEEKDDQPAGAVLADGACFASLEKAGSYNGSEENIIGQVLGVSLASPARGASTQTLSIAQRADAATQCMKDLLKTIQKETDQIAAVFVSGTNYSDVDQSEVIAVKEVFPADNDAALLSIGKQTGQLMEAGGLLEAAVFNRIKKSQNVPDHLILDAPGMNPRKIQNQRNVCLILRSSFWGDVSCLAVEI